MGQSTLSDELASGRISPVCNHNVPPGRATCALYVLNDKKIAVRSTCYSGSAITDGYAPCDLVSAYNLKNSIGLPGGLVAVVNYYKDPYIASDLAMYRQTFGMKACPQNSCFYQVNEHGGSNGDVKDNPVSAVEWTVDVDMISANCPNCKIVLVEAKSVDPKDLEAAEYTAATRVIGGSHVVAIDNSWYLVPSYSPSDPSFVRAFVHPHIAMTANAGDHGYGVTSPAQLNTVTAAVGTSLRPCTSCTPREWTETVWNDTCGPDGCATGSGCSDVIAAPTWQAAIESVYDLKGCHKRVVGDIAYDADPETGVAIYCTYGEPDSTPCTKDHWPVYGGTSVSAPAIAALYALAASKKRLPDIPAEVAYENVIRYGYSSKESAFYNIRKGNNIINGGPSCSGSLYWLCHAEPGSYSAPAGVGSPNGIGGF